MTRSNAIIAIVVVAALIAVTLLAADYAGKMPIKEVRSAVLSVCNSKGLTCSDVELQAGRAYSDATFYSVKITCTGFSALSGEEMLDCFKSISRSDDYNSRILFREPDISVVSDGHTYTFALSSPASGFPDTIYRDGEAIYKGEVPEKREYSYSGDYDRDSNARHTDDEAFAVAQKIVKENLKSPSTAKFCSILQASVSNSGNKYTVTGWVDSQNSFGATLRTSFTVTYSAIKHGGEIGYKEASVTFD